MKKQHLHIVLSSVLFYRKKILVQAIIIALLASVITGSLLTGYSVRKSLRNISESKIGNTAILVSSGNRFFEPALAQRLGSRAGERTSALTELNGYCMNFSTQDYSERVKVYAIDDDFFTFHGNGEISFGKGEVLINRNLADRLKISTGDEILLSMSVISEIPADAPFSAGQKTARSSVFRIAGILEAGQTGNFSLGISQSEPSNIFIHPADLAFFSEMEDVKPNRLIAENRKQASVSDIDSALKEILIPEDISLSFRKTGTNDQVELVSGRIFIDPLIAEDIGRLLPASAPVITYMANSISAHGNITPYSFISAVPDELYNVPSGSDMAVSKWLAEDLQLTTCDSVSISWFAPDSVNSLKEEKEIFRVADIVPRDSVWGDRTLMPEFPGISGSESCSDWDAGVPIDLSLIRTKDEQYWDNYKGTPKAFISYETGRRLWSNNFGPATSIRFPPGAAEENLRQMLAGRIEPSRSGFSVTDLRKEILRAAGESVDFSTLFLSLGFFIILSSFLLLSLSATGYFNTKKDHILTFFSIGYPYRLIRKLILAETFIISFTGALAGAFAGMLINKLAIGALNSVWQGAVHTDTLTAASGLLPVEAGFIVTLFALMVFFYVKTRSFFKSLEGRKEDKIRFPSMKVNSAILLILAPAAVVLAIASIISGNNIGLSFTAGIAVFAGLIILLRHYFLGGIFSSANRKTGYAEINRKYYMHNPATAIAPAIFIAAGVFTIFITTLNRTGSGSVSPEVRGGTGGYLFWAETGIPVTEDLSVAENRSKYGLGEPGLEKFEIVQMLRKEGDDASCLNLNHVSSPPLLGIDASAFSERGAFSFAGSVGKSADPWKLLKENPGKNTIYGIADQTVLQWGLKLKTGDTLVLRAETGQRLNIILAAGLKASVFQGNVLIDAAQFRKYFPSVAGSSAFLVGGVPDFAESYHEALAERLSGYGIRIEPAAEKLASFQSVTNTYLSVFSALGTFGMILGVCGLGFILFRNYNDRKREFALLIATGYNSGQIRRMLFGNLLIILTEGIITGLASSIIATLPSVQNNNELPLTSLILAVLSIFVTGLAVLLISVRRTGKESLAASLRNE